MVRFLSLVTKSVFLKNSLSLNSELKEAKFFSKKDLPIIPFLSHREIIKEVVKKYMTSLNSLNEILEKIYPVTKEQYYNFISIVESAVKKFKEIPKNKRIKLISHLDADGITSAAIMINALINEKERVRIRNINTAKSSLVLSEILELKKPIQI